MQKGSNGDVTSRSGDDETEEHTSTWYVTPHRGLSGS
uniref:Uncharacterized protein n=1 Tax=Ciona intestinalis TaxID=7719 RepID=F6SG58_CIOIN